MRYLSLFSGIEAATVAWQPLGFIPAEFSEIDPYPCAVLNHHYPDVPNLGDVKKITEVDIARLGQIDIVVFGSPCTDVSIAGKRKGFIDENGYVTRSGLFAYAIEIIGWARKHCGTRFALWENVPGIFSSNKGRDFAAVVEQMAGPGDVSIPKNGWGTEGAAVGDYGMLEWSVLDAQWFGLAQRRKRVFVIVDFGDWASRPPILLERYSLRGDIAPSRKKGEGFTHDIAPSITKSGRGVSRAGDTRGQDPVVAFRAFGQDGFTPDNISPPILASDGGGAGVPTVNHKMLVRRLTERECARLQGFPDDYLDIVFKGKPAAGVNKYKALGNSMAVPVMRYIGEKINEVVDYE